MKLTTAQFSRNLETNVLPPVIWISGDEALLVIEACDQVRQTARAAGFEERTIINADAKFDGADLVAENQSMSLFGSRTCIELRIQSKLNDKGRKALIETIEQANPDHLLLIISGRIEASQTKAKWFNQVINSGWWLPIWPIERHQMKAWLAQRLTHVGLKADDNALSLLQERTDGNLLAAKQEIEKLALLSLDGVLTADVILSSVSDNSRYSVFDLSSAFLSGDLTRSLKIMNSLEAEGLEPSIVLWLLTREMRLVIALNEAQELGEPIQSAFRRLRIFDKHQHNYQVALRRAPNDHYQKCLLACTHIDATIKGQLKGDPWILISEMLVAISAPELPAYTI